VNHPATKARLLRRLGTLALAVLVATGLMYALVSAQAPPAAPAQAPSQTATPQAAKKVLTVDDYTKWRTISAQELSGDGTWLAYELQPANLPRLETKPLLHLVNLAADKDVEIASASGAKFSADSMWVAYQVDPSGRGGAGRGGRGATVAPAATAGGQPDPAAAQTGGGQAGRSGTTPPAQPQRVELRRLDTGAIQSWQDVESFSFSANATHLLLRRRPVAAAGAASGRAAAGGDSGGAPPAPAAPAAAAAATPAAARGVDVTLHNLATGRDLFLGSVGDAAFNKSGELLAYSVDAATKDANGLFVLDLRNGRVHALDNAARSYARLTWSEDGVALAVLKGADVDRMRERDNVLVAFPNVQAALDAGPKPVTLEPAKADGFPKGWVVSDRAALSWSDDKKRVFFGMKAQVAAPDPNRRRETTDAAADVDVWNTADERVQSFQMARAEADRNFTFRSVFDVAASKFVRLADETMRELDVAPDGRWAVGRDIRGYVHDYKRASADIYRVNTTTGERTLMLKAQMTNTSTGAHTYGLSPDGRFFLYWKDNKFQAYDLDAGASKTLAAPAAVSFVDMEFDHPGPKPSYGIAGYTSDGKHVIVQHRYDLWLLPLDGTAGRNLTNGVGTKNEIRFRYVRTEPLDPGAGGAPGGPGGGGGRGGGASARATIDLAKPITLSAYGEYTKKAGFYELAGGQLKEIVYEDASFSNPVKAAKADKFLFTRQTFVEFPDLRVSGPNFKDSKKVSNANPQQAEYRWGHRILFDYKNKDGVRLQGILAIPDDYKPGEKRPMIVTFYEKNSQNMHRYTAPSYLTGMGASAIQAVSEGYLTMLPDVYFRTGASHSDMLECVEAATKKVIEMGYVDPKHIGVHGHSYGGEGAAFIGTRSRLFAAVGMGAGVVDLTFDFTQNWGWSYAVTAAGSGGGNNAFDYYLYSQGREGVSPWDKPELYRFESALTHAPEVTAPFLIMHGGADPTVPFTNGLAMYNALRYLGKTAVFLSYPGEGHGLAGMANRKDLTVRYFEFFNHYLKGAAAPKWLSEGVTFLQKEAARDARPAAPAAAPVVR